MCETNEVEFSWTIDRLKERLEQETFQEESPMFVWGKYPVLARASLAVEDDGQVRVWMDLQHLQRGQPLLFEYIPTVYYVVKDGSGNSERRDIVRASSYLLGTVIPYRGMYRETLMHRSWLAGSVYDVEDSLTVHIVVEAPTLAEKVVAYDGCVGLHLSGYRTVKQVQAEGLSPFEPCPYIYTGGLGYRVQVNFYLAGFGAHCRDALGVAVCFLPGVFDGLLPIYFPHQTKVVVYNTRRPGRWIAKKVWANIDQQSVISFEVCGHEEIEDMLGSDDDISFHVTITHLSEVEEWSGDL